MKVELECPECGVYAPPPFAYPRPVYKCDNCGARTPHAELRARKTYAQAHGLKGAPIPDAVYAQGAVGAGSYFSAGRLISALSVDNVGVGSCDIIVVTVGCYDPVQIGAAPSSVSLGANNLTQIFSTQGSGSISAPFMNGSAWYGVNVPNGTYSCTATWAAAHIAGSMAVSRISNRSVSPLDKQVVATDSAAFGGPEPSSGSTGGLSQAKEVCLASYVSIAPLGITWDPPFTVLQTVITGGILTVGDAIDVVNSTSPVTASGTQTIVHETWICAVNTFKVTA